MADPTHPVPQPPTPRPGASAVPAGGGGQSTNAMPCDRCGTEMFRMHAVWRCPHCGYKTDCCGW